MQPVLEDVERGYGRELRKQIEYPNGIDTPFGKKTTFYHHMLSNTFEYDGTKLYQHVIDCTRFQSKGVAKLRVREIRNSVLVRK
jgi:hypothetical protein